MRKIILQIVYRFRVLPSVDYLELQRARDPLRSVYWLFSHELHFLQNKEQRVSSSPCACLNTLIITIKRFVQWIKYCLHASVLSPATAAEKQMWPIF